MGLSEPPTKEEKNNFQQLLGEFESVNATKKDVSDVTQTFQKPIVNTLICNSNDRYNQVVTVVRTSLAKFDDINMHQDIVTGGSYTWNCRETIQGGHITLECNNELRINPKVIADDPNVEPKLHRIENLVITYHELLHGQLMIDAIKNSPIWKKEICNQPAGSIDYSFADSDHKTINYLQTQFASELVNKIGGTMISKELSFANTHNGIFTIPVLNFSNYPAYQNGAKITLRTNNISNSTIFKVDNDVYLTGQLKDYAKPGMAWFYIFGSNSTQIMTTNETVPMWAKRVAGLWSEGSIVDSDFFIVIDYMIENHIIQSNNKSSISYVPHWVKKTVQMLYEGQISDESFVNSIEYLMAKRIIS